MLSYAIIYTYSQTYTETLMEQYLLDENISFPKFWDAPVTLNALLTLGTYEQYAFFGCSNATSFTRLMKPCFPNRPERTSYSKYLRDLVEKNKV